MNVQMEMRMRSCARPSATIKIGVTKKLISITGRRPRRSVNSPPLNCARNDPAPKKETISAAVLTGISRWAVRYSVRKGMTKPPRRLINVPVQINQYVGGKPSIREARPFLFTFVFLWRWQKYYRCSKNKRASEETLSYLLCNVIARRSRATTKQSPGSYKPTITTKQEIASRHQPWRAVLGKAIATTLL